MKLKTKRQKQFEKERQFSLSQATLTNYYEKLRHQAVEVIEASTHSDFARALNIFHHFYLEVVSKDISFSNEEREGAYKPIERKKKFEELAEEQHEEN